MLSHPNSRYSLLGELAGHSLHCRVPDFVVLKYRRELENGVQKFEETSEYANLRFW